MNVTARHAISAPAIEVFDLGSIQFARGQHMMGSPQERQCAGADCSTMTTMAHNSHVPDADRFDTHLS
jgi:hypothetical protein